MSKVILFTKPQCVQCVQTYKALSARGVEFVSKDVTANTDDFQFVTDTLNYSAAPVVVIYNSVGDIADSWSGFNPEKINEWF
jgi:glutaredoxin-like protein NrdH